MNTKSFMVTLLLCLAFGPAGAHRFYVGKTRSAILMALTFGGLTFWAFFDVYQIITGKFTDVEGRIIKP